MLDEVRDLLERQTDFLTRQETEGEFLVQVPAYLTALRWEPQIAIHMEDLRREASDMLSLHEVHDAEEIAELVLLREELVRAAPETDDAGEPTPPSAASAAVFAWERTLAAFDRVVRDELRPDRTRSSRGPGKTGWLIEILGSKISELQFPWQKVEGRTVRIEQNQRPDLDDLVRRIGNISRRHDHFVNAVRLAERTSAGLALARLDLVLEALNPPADVIESAQDVPMHLSDVLRYISSGGYSLFKAVHGDRLDSGDTRYVDERVKSLRKDVERLHEELRRRIGTTASRLAVILRFKHRTEWYDRDRLRALAEQPGPGTIEDRLTSELVRFLFDAGLSPLTKPMVGSLEPDVLDPSLRPALYVEAKQYGDPGNARRTVTRSVAQVHDTAGTMRGEPYGVTESFVVIFRRGGPRYSLPEQLRGDGWTTHLILVDVSPAEKSGSRARRKPVNLTVDDFLDRR